MGVSWRAERAKKILATTVLYLCGTFHLYGPRYLLASLWSFYTYIYIFYSPKTGSKTKK